MRMIIAAAVLACAGIGGAQAGVLERAKETGELRIGYRTDAQPFSFKEFRGQGRGLQRRPLPSCGRGGGGRTWCGRAEGDRDRRHRGGPSGRGDRGQGRPAVRGDHPDHVAACRHGLLHADVRDRGQPALSEGWGVEFRAARRSEGGRAGRQHHRDGAEEGAGCSQDRRHHRRGPDAQGRHRAPRQRRARQPISATGPSCSISSCRARSASGCCLPTRCSVSSPTLWRCRRAMMRFGWWSTGHWHDFAHRRRSVRCSSAISVPVPSPAS